MKNHYMKKIISLTLAAVMLLAVGVSASAREPIWFNVNLPGYTEVTEGSPITLFVDVVSSEYCRYEWYEGGVPIPGAGNSPYLTAYFSYDAEVYCVVTSSIAQVVSNSCYVHVIPAARPTASPSYNYIPKPTITRQPSGAQLAIGQNAVLSVAATNYNAPYDTWICYQWYASNTNSAATAAPIAGANSSSYTTNTYDGNKYYICAIWSTDGINSGDIAYTNMVAVTYNSNEFKITKNPTGETVDIGGSALFVARADNAAKREWRIVSKDTTKTVPANQASAYFAGLRVSGENTDTLALSNIPASMDGWSVECKFTALDGRTLFTNGAILKIRGATPAPAPAATEAPTEPSPSPSIPGTVELAAPAIVQQPVGAVLAEGETVLLSVAASGIDANSGVTLSYQWYRNEQNSNASGTAIPGATQETYVPDTISGSRYYYAGVTARNAAGEEKTTFSNPATVTYTASISSPAPTQAPVEENKSEDIKNPGMLSMLIGPAIAITVAAVAIGVGVFFLLRGISKKKDKEAERDRRRQRDYYDD